MRRSGAERLIARPERTRAWGSGQARARRRRSAERPEPAVWGNGALRIRVGRAGTKEAAIGALIAFAREDPAAHERITGRSAPIAFSTLNGFWRQIPLPERERARARRERGAAP